MSLARADHPGAGLFSSRRLNLSDPAPISCGHRKGGEMPIVRIDNRSVVESGVVVLGFDRAEAEIVNGSLRLLLTVDETLSNVNTEVLPGGVIRMSFGSLTESRILYSDAGVALSTGENFNCAIIVRGVPGQGTQKAHQVDYTITRT